MIYDILLPCAPKDIPRLKYLIPSIENNLEGFNKIYVVTPDPELVTKDVIAVSDKDILDIDHLQFKWRPNWIKQQYIKMFQDITDQDLYLTIDGDLLFNRPMAMFEGDKPIIWMGWEQNHRPYFNFQEVMLDLPRLYPHTFINDMNFFSKKIIREMLTCNNYSVDSFIAKSVEVISKDCFPGEPEIYGQYVHRYHPDMYVFKQAKSRSIGRYVPTIDGISWTDADIEAEIEHMRNQDFDLFTLHTWYDMKV